MLSKTDQAKWRRKHIPHRVRAGIARLDMRQSILKVFPFVDPNPTSMTSEDRIYWRCSTDSIWEGRLAATRWLIGFIGVSQKENGAPGRPAQRDKDLNIEKLDGGVLFDLNTQKARFLAKIWKGCSQASSHATHKSNHPKVNEKQLSKALAVVVKHLQDTVYKQAGETLRNYVLEAVRVGPSRPASVAPLKPLARINGRSSDLPKCETTWLDDSAAQ
jgi:hypothetical protein